MKRCLADVKVILPLLVRHHVHHQSALDWFDRLEPGEGAVCRFVQLALIRLLGNRSIMREHAVSAAEAWRVIEELMQDERLEFEPEPASMDSIFPRLLNYPLSTNKLIADAYLAAFSIAGNMRLVSIDQGFVQFRGLELELLT